MIYILRYWYLLLLLIGMSACSIVDVDNSADEDGNNMLRLNITIQNSQQNSSRTPVVEPDDNMLGAKHHVSYVKLYVINDETNSSDYQNILLTKPFVWEQYNSDTQQAGYDKHTMTVEIEWNAIGEINDISKLRIIAIGLDATDITDLENPSGNSADAYLYDSSGKFDNIAEGRSLFSDETSNTLINPIPRSEFYAGCSKSFSPSDVTGIGKPGIEVILNRRVAGFVGYFKDIPENVKYIGIGSGHIGKSFQTSLPILSKEQLEIEDESNLNKNLPGAEEGYLPIEMASLFDDMIFVPVNDDSQAEQQLKARDGTGTVGSGDKNPDPELIENGKIMGFMPPMTIDVADYGENTSTLMLNLYGEKEEIVGSSDKFYHYPLIKSVKILLESSVYPGQGSRAGTGIIEDDGDRDLKYQYPIRANEIYRIGTMDNPISLDGSVSYVTLQIDEAWDEYYGGSMNGDKQDGIGIDTEWGDHPAGEIETSSD